MRRWMQVTKWPAALLLTILMLAAVVAGQQKTAPDLEVRLKAAMQKELVEGDLKGAIEQYKKIVADAGSNRAVAAKALLEMGQCYEKLGQAESANAYERILREYADQLEQAAQARTRLAALARPAGTANPPGVVVRQIWTGPDVNSLGGISGDGRYLSYVDWETGDLAIRDLSTGENRRLTDGPRGEFAFYSRISPDGKTVAYVWVDKENPYHLRVTSIDDLKDGVKPRVLYRNTPQYMDFGDWSPDGKYVLANIRGGIDLISTSDGAMTVLKTLNWGSPKPRFSPDGRWIVYNVRPVQDSPDRDIFVLATDGSREIPLVEHPGDDFVLGWAPDGKRILFASDRSGVLSAWVIAVADGRPQGAPELVKPDIGNIQPIGFSRAGSFYYGLSTGMPDVYVTTLDPATGRALIPPAPVSQRFQGRGSSPAWSSDGEFIAYLSARKDPINSAVGPRVICIRSLQTGEEREISTPLSFEITSPPTRLHWSPDGRFLLATAMDSRGRGGLYRIDVQSGEVAPIVQGASRSFRPVGVWSTDGKTIFYRTDDTIRSRNPNGGQEKEIYRHPVPVGSMERDLALSTDGRWLAFLLHGALTLMPSAGGTPRELWRIKEGEVFVSGVEWAAGGKYLLFSKGPSQPGRDSALPLWSKTPELWRISVDGGEPQRIGLATQNRGTLAIHADGRQIAFTAGQTKEEVWVMENFLPKTGENR